MDPESKQPPEYIDQKSSTKVWIWSISGIMMTLAIITSGFWFFHNVNTAKSANIGHDVTQTKTSPSATPDKSSDNIKATAEVNIDKESAGGLANQHPIVSFAPTLYPYTKGLITFPIDEGSHNKFNCEWWYYNFNFNNTQGFVAVARGPLNGARVNVAFLQFTEGTGKLVSEALVGSLSSDAKGQNVSFTGRNINNVQYTIKFTTPAPFKYKIDILGNSKNISIINTNRKIPLTEGGKGFVAITPTTSSYYYSLTDLDSVASLNFGTGTKNISGKSWFDHQWFNTGNANVLDEKVSQGSNSINHEWFSANLSNGSDLVFWKINPSKNAAPMYYLGQINTAGTQTNFTTFTLTPISYWTSPVGKKYANQWRMKTGGIDLTIKTKVPDQALRFLNPLTRTGYLEFYEGATTIKGSYNGATVSGSGFTELSKTY